MFQTCYSQDTIYHGVKLGYMMGMNFRLPGIQQENNLKNAYLHGVVWELKLGKSGYFEYYYIENKRKMNLQWPNQGDYYIKENRYSHSFSFGNCIQDKPKYSFIVGGSMVVTHLYFQVYSPNPDLNQYIQMLKRRDAVSSRVFVKYEYHLNDYFGIGGYFYSGFIPQKKKKEVNMYQIFGISFFMQARTPEYRPRKIQ
ncbi:MAG: hypothetical protein JNL57_08575 [Bacteroidetes bacterium]|nr:hypothetical protein [Bacteroidota bacterium]